MYVCMYGVGWSVGRSVRTYMVDLVPNGELLAHGVARALLLLLDRDVDHRVLQEEPRQRQPACGVGGWVVVG